MARRLFRRTDLWTAEGLERAAPLAGLTSRVKIGLGTTRKARLSSGASHIASLDGKFQG